MPLCSPVVGSSAAGLMQLPERLWRFTRHTGGIGTQPRRPSLAWPPRGARSVPRNKAPAFVTPCGALPASTLGVLVVSSILIPFLEIWGWLDTQTMDRPSPSPRQRSIGVRRPRWRKGSRRTSKMRETLRNRKHTSGNNKDGIVAYMKRRRK